MSSPAAASRTVVSFLLLLLTGSHAVQLDELIGNKAKFISPLTIHSLSKDTALISATPFYVSFEQLNLSPTVSVPKPRGTQSTLLLSRVHPKNETVIWANAVTTFGEIDYGVAVDSEENIFVAGMSGTASGRGRPPKDSIVLIKFSSSGSLLWEAFYTPPKRGGAPLYFLDEFDTGLHLSVLVFASKSQLVLTARRRRSFTEKPVFLVFDASNGRFLRAFEPKLPKTDGGFIDPTNVAVRDTRRGPLACFAFSGTKDTFDDPEKLYASCTRLGAKESSVVRKLESLNSTDDFYHLNGADIDRSAGRTSLFFASEKVGRPQKRRLSHEIFVRRVSSKTLQEVSWATGKESPSARPIIISLPERTDPDFGNTHATFQLDLKYGPKTRTVAFLFWSSILLKGFEQESRTSRKIVAKGRQRKRFEPIQYWLFFIDEKRRLSAELLPINDDIRKEEEQYFDLERIRFNADESAVYVAGRVKSKLLIRCVPNPSFRGKGKKNSC